MWHYPCITTDTLYSSRGLPCVLHCTAAPAVTVMPVDRGLLEVEDQTEAPRLMKVELPASARLLAKGSLVAQHSGEAQFKPGVVL